MIRQNPFNLPPNPDVCDVAEVPSQKELTFFNGRSHDMHRISPSLLGEGTLWLSATPARPGSAFPLLFEPRILRWARFAFVDEPARTFLVVPVHLAADASGYDWRRVHDGRVGAP